MDYYLFKLYLVIFLLSILSMVFYFSFIIYTIADVPISPLCEPPR